jgi:hypothetical protein
MSDHAEVPLQIDLTDRVCHRRYLLLAHLLPGLVAVLALSGPQALLSCFLLLLSGVYWWRREGAGQHPRSLHWDAGRGWRVSWSRRQAPVRELPRFLVLGPCLLLQLDRELLFLREQRGLNRLRRLLRAASADSGGGG